LEEIQSVFPNIIRNSRASDEESSDEEDAVGDSNFAEDFFHYQELGEAKVRPRGVFTVLPRLRTEFASSRISGFLQVSRLATERQTDKVPNLKL
jgi:hypothetical protein